MSSNNVHTISVSRSNHKTRPLLETLSVL